MILTRLRIAGFKSFVDPTEFLIEPGLTGVVGPNGCGKSNLVEALRWVMGESSFKSLRASGMDDVIFAGSGNRPARNTAEVALLIDNRLRTAPAAFNDAEELDVSRKIERESGSTYRINGREVRARDVQLLFADASTGARSPAMVRQGQIGEIISAKPQARRRILEDAAGVAGLHTRRHEAELRLKAAEDNVQRLEDVLQQIDSQAEGLKRQAKQAARYRTLAADIRKYESVLLFLSLQEARQHVLEAEAKVEADLLAVAERAKIQGEAATAQAIAAHQLPSLRDAEIEAAAALQRLRLAREQLDQEEARARQRAVELERRAEEFTRDLEREKIAVSDSEAALARLLAEAETLIASSDADEAAEMAREKLAVLEDELASAEQALGEAQTLVSDINAQRAAAERALREEKDRVQRFQAEQDKLQRELALIEETHGNAADLVAMAEEIEALEMASMEADDRAQAARAAHAEAREREAALRGPLAEADRAAQRLETEVRTLAKLVSAGGGDLFPAVLDLIKVEKGFETALGAALGDDLDASIDTAAPAHWSVNGDGTDDPALPAGVRSLAECVDAPPELARRLKQIGLVSNDEGRALAKQLKAGQRLVTPEGDLWRWDGFTTAADAPTPAARRLAEKNRLGDLEVEAAQARATVEQLRGEADSAQTAIRIAAQQETETLETARNARRSLDDGRERRAMAERKQSEVAAKHSALTEALHRVAESLTEAQAKVEAAEAQMSNFGDARELEQKLSAARFHAEGRRAAAAEARAVVAGLAREAEMRQRRLTAIRDESESWEARKRRSSGQIEEIERRIATVQDERVALAEAPDSFELQRRDLAAAVEAAELKRKEAADRLAEAETTANAADKFSQQALADLATAREEKVRSEGRLEAARERLEACTRAVPERLEMSIDELAEAVVHYGDLPEVRECEKQLETLKADREKLGAVNLRAEEELIELEDKQGALVTERDDLTEAIKRLRVAIAELNKEGRERLLAAFTVVQGHFERLFTLLFGGGTAQLQLIESDDPLEAGLEIVARPPGKKPQTMTLLSGGEQALTAIALIFAVFLTNPSPICVLDEVDAPLDDANVERYCDLLHDMAKETDTRFVVITHNPITMARMDRLFGVTMAERGVSQLVSVDLGEAERFLEAS